MRLVDVFTILVKETAFTQHGKVPMGLICTRFSLLGCIGHVAKWFHCVGTL